MTRIDDVSTNGMNIKHLDTTKDIVITLRDESGGQVLPNPAHTWTAKVSDDSNYVGDYPLKLESNSIVVNSADFTNLPAGNYHLEIWEEWIDSNSKKQRSIYPSPQRTIDFTIYQNVTDLAEKEIKTIGFQDVVDQAVMNIGMNYVFKVNTIEPDQTATVVQAAADGKNYVTFNIPQGKAGEQGFRGPAGKAFQIKQTFASVKAMEDSQGKDFDDGDFALIASNTLDPDNSKLYVWSDANKEFTYMDDLSGAQGIQGPVGPAPTLHVTEVTTVPNGEQPSFTATSVGNGNYNVEIGLPKGDKGDTGTVDNAGLTTAPAFVSLNSKINDITSNGGGRNLVAGTGQEYAMGYSIPTTTWEDGYAYLKLPTNTTPGIDEIVPQEPNTFFHIMNKGTTYTQTIWFETDAKLITSSGIQFTWYTNEGHDTQPATLINLGENKYKLCSTYMWPGKGDNNVRLFDIFFLDHAFDLSAGTYLKFGKLMLEEGIISHDWTPAPEDAPNSDSQLVHKTGNETLAGDKVFVGNTTLATTTILAGNYGLRVTTSGIEKTTDGKTWVPANI